MCYGRHLGKVVAHGGEASQHENRVVIPPIGRLHSALEDRADIHGHMRCNSDGGAPLQRRSAWPDWFADLCSTALSSASISNAERRNILKRRAYLNERIDQIDRAVEDWSSAINIEPVDPALYGSRGFLYLRLHRYDDALADFAKGEALDARTPTFAYGLGRVESDRGDYDEAIRSYTKALSLDPDHATALLWRGEAYLVQKNYPNAQLDFEREIAAGHALLPNARGRLYLGLGFVKMKTSQFAQAVPDLDKGLEIIPNHLSGLRARTFSLEKLGDRKRALEDYERILSLQPNDSWAAENRSKLQAR